MGRSRLTNISQDLVSDGGSVLWSFVKGEQLEFPITLNFIEDATLKPGNNYIYEAVVVEANNVANQAGKPTSVKQGGIHTRLFIRIPKYVGAWQAASAYTKEEVVHYSGKYYRLLTGLARVSSITPVDDPIWSETTLNKVYIQFPTTLASDWEIKPGVESPSYGFFELRVTEPDDIVFSRTFKPLRGMVEILFSPTDEVLDRLEQSSPA